MCDITWWWGGRLVVCDWEGGIDESAVGGECEARLPVVDACGAIGDNALGERKLDARSEAGNVELGVFD